MLWQTEWPDSTTAPTTTTMPPSTTTTFVDLPMPVGSYRVRGVEADDVLNRHVGLYETGVVYYLDGARSDQFNSPGELNRAPHFAGGRMRTLIPEIGKTYSVSMWFWNGMPSDDRPLPDSGRVALGVIVRTIG